MAITAVHPMREDAVRELLSRAGAGVTLVRDLLEGGQVVETLYDGRKYYLRRIKGVSVRGQTDG